MKSMFRPAAAVLMAAALAAVAGCSLEDTPIPNPSGPSALSQGGGVAFSVTAIASPDRLPRDGQSQSVVALDVRDAQGRAVANQRLSVAVTPSTARLSATEVITDASGRATVSVTAPPSSVIGDTITVSATPVGNGADVAVARTVTIALSGTSNTTVPTAAFTFSPAAPVLQENVVFDASTSTDEGVACRDLCTYSWDFGGEATRTGRVVTYQFQAIRTYPVRLTVTDPAGASGVVTTNVAVGQGTGPAVSFTFSPAAPAIRQTINFTAEASRPGTAGRTLTSFQWRFGDGTTATGVTAQHSYSVVGTYPVVLTVTDSAGVQTTTSQNVTVITGVTAAFTSNALPERVVIFNAESSRGSDTGFGTRNPIVRYIWHFGDTTSLTETSSPIISHEYPFAQAFTVTLTVEDSAGRRETVTGSATAID